MGSLAQAGQSQVHLTFEGDGVELLDQEAGIHRIQRVPDNDRRGRVHSSTITVAVLGESPSISENKLVESDLKIEWYSGSGAGGQHRNKHPNCARITHLPTGLVRTAQARSRNHSQTAAIAALREALGEREKVHASHIRQHQRVAQIGVASHGDRGRIWAFQRDRVEDGRSGRSIRLKDALLGKLEGLWGA